MENWEERYKYTYLHGILFVDFPCLLYEWLKRETTTGTYLRLEEPLV
jgi:hypothetical protein